MDAWAWIVIALIVVAVVAVALFAVRARRTRGLRQRFGPEYDREVDRREGDRTGAESELKDRAERRDALEIRPLSRSDADEYRDRWHVVQAQFVDEPVEAVGAADGLLSEVMTARGYPADDDFMAQADVISADHPEVVEDYREGHRIHGAHASGDAGTEDLRQAMVHYRALFERLVGADREHQTEHAREVR